MNVNVSLENSVSDTTPIKKRKVDGLGLEGCQSNSVFTNFKLHKILREDSSSKSVTLHGFFHKESSDSVPNKSPPKMPQENDAPAVILLERKAFDVVNLQHSLQLSQTIETLKNDIYSTHDVFSSDVAADTKATIIYPATEKHIAKYSDHEPYIVRETPELYREVTLPCLESNQFSVQWVYNILEKKTESDRIVVEDPDLENGFIILPDMKWDRKNTETLYLVALVHKHGLRSIRDLRQEHIPLLKNIQRKGQEAIKNMYGITADKLRMFFHYQPSYYHLHIHFTHIKWEPPGFNALRAHMFEDVIENLEMDSDFYQKKTISYVVRDNDALFKAYHERGYFSKDTEKV